ncbi:MAG: hypothetical protein ACP5OG_04110 [Candidatus Nanoarchaeia archaeon]
MKIKTEKDKLLNGKIRKKIIYPLIFGIAALSLNPSHIAKDTVDYSYVNSSPESKIRKEFRQKFGFPIYGDSKYIEENPKNISIIAEALTRERFEKEFSLKGIYILPKDAEYWNKFNKDGLDPAGCYNRLLDSITLNFETITSSNFTHELKHNKTFEISQINPEFLDKWKDLAKDENGNSLYLSDNNDPNQVRFFSYKELEKNGFISPYSQIHVIEDIAVICQSLGSGSDAAIFIYLNYEKNQKIIDRIKLAQEYQILPKESLEYFELIKNLPYKKNQDTLELLFLKSQEFLDKYPKSVYTSEILRGRASLKQRSQEHKYSSDEIIRDFKKVLNCKYKPLGAYNSTLLDLSQEYETLGDNKRKELYSNAHTEYYKRLNSGDVHIATRGVNDFLIENGELEILLEEEK